MKGNNGLGNIIERDEWQTLQWLFDKLNEQYCFTIDCCANEDNKKCKFWTSFFEDVDKKGLKIYKIINCWMNPPFSKAKEMFEHFFKIVKKGVVIYRCDNMETKIWQEVIFPNASWIFIPHKRIVYGGLIGKGARFPSAIIGLNVDPIKNLSGTILKVKG